MNKPIPDKTTDLLKELRSNFGYLNAHSLLSFSSNDNKELFVELGKQQLMEFLEQWLKNTEEGAYTGVFSKDS